MKSKVVDIILVVAVLAGTAQLLIARNVEPSRQNDTAAPVAPPSVDSIVATVEGREIRPIAMYGDSATTQMRPTAGAVPRVVFVFRPDCRFCEANAGSWRELSSTLPGVVVAMNPEDPRTAARWLARHSIAAHDTWVPIDLKQYQEVWGVSAVPATLLLSPEGHVQRAFFGVLSDAAMIEIADSARAVRKSVALQGS